MKGRNITSTLTLYISITLALSSCAEKNSKVIDAQGAPLVSQEKHRPRVHFSPAKGWMNDPNGLFFLNGEYHLFYQYYPDTTVWGPMHWGHAVSRDLILWEHLPIALYPDSLGYIFSGSAVVDTHNTSGLGAKENPPVVAIFTYHDPEGERAGRNDFQSQGIAYSLDKGRSWKKYERNPVLKSPGIRDFRDPKVSWSDEARQWVMTLAVKDHVEFYGSPDLKTWTKLSEFGKNEGAHGGVWECPDLFKITDTEGKAKHVLLLSVNPGAPNGGSGTQYFVGNFDGKRFVSDTPGRNAGWIDYGTDDYAGVTFSNVSDSDGRRLFIGWMSNWLYAQVVPTSSWRSAMTIPRELTLEKTSKGHVLKSKPVKELNNLVTATQPVDAVVGVDSLTLFKATDSTAIPVVVTGAVNKGSFTIELRNDKKQKLLAGFDAQKNVFYVDRSDTPSDFHPDFKSRMTAPRSTDTDSIDFIMVIDVASVELFFDDGSTTLTAITFPDEVFRYVTLRGEGSKITAGPLQVQVLKSVP